jgi:hypothetical protein
MSEARARVSLTDGVLEFEGSESFVTSQVEKFTTIIHPPRALRPLLTPGSKTSLKRPRPACRFCGRSPARAKQRRR